MTLPAPVPVGVGTRPATPCGARADTYRLKVDMIACDGRGLCAELLPELVRLDDWGFPVLERGGAVPGDLLAVARYAVEACPRLALGLERS